MPQAGGIFEPEEELAAAKVAVRPTAEEPPVCKSLDINAIKVAIANASTLEEVRQLEEALRGGTMQEG